MMCLDMEEELLGLLKETDALITDGHFVGTSGRHMDTYVNKDALIMHPLAVSRVGELFAELNMDTEIDVVIAPAVGAIALGQWTAFHLSKLKDREILSVYTEKDGEAQVLKRGYDKQVAGKKVLAIEDVTTTGGSVLKTVTKVREAGGEVVQVSVLMNKSPETITSESMGVPFNAIATMSVETYEEAACPLCASGVPVNASVGHGKKFLASKGV
jgi:orotate phosphoribosyltransferase